MEFRHEIGSYQIIHPGKTKYHDNPIATINLFNTDNRCVGGVQFYRNDQEIPNNSSYESRDPKRAFLKMHLNRFDSVVDMLRNEKPCSVVYRRPTYAFLYTGEEPVGEE